MGLDTFDCFFLAFDLETTPKAIELFVSTKVVEDSIKQDTNTAKGGDLGKTNRKGDTVENKTKTGSSNSVHKKEEIQIDSDDQHINVGNKRAGWWQLGVIGLPFLIGIYFIVMFFRTKKMNTSKNSIEKEELREVIREELSNFLRKELTEKKLRKIIREELQPFFNENTQNVQIQEQEGAIKDDEVSEPITMSTEPAQGEEKKMLYAGKPTKDREFINVHQEKDPQNSIYKLTEIEEGKAEFEVIIAGKIMQKYITNAPDDHLYRVCNHKNSNRDFKKDITTVKKGIAEEIDGKWQVREENKALIEFV